MLNNLIQINPTLLVERQILNFLLNSEDTISKMILNTDTNSDVIFLQYSGKNDMISYLLKSKVDFDLNNLLPESFDISNYKVQNMKVGRIVKKLFPSEKILDKDIEHFVNSYRSFFDKNKLTFKIIQGEEIKDWYDQDNYSTLGKGTLWGSCMRYKERLKFLDLYCKNKNIKLLILTCDENGVEKLRGRALLWDDVILNEHYHSLPGEIKIMDRIYTVLDSDTILFKNWAYQNEYIHKLEQNAKSHLFFANKSDVLKLSIRIPIKRTQFRWYPYLDTFCYFNDFDGYLTNDSYNERYDYELKQANGNLVRDEEEEEN